MQCHGTKFLRLGTWLQTASFALWPCFWHFGSRSRSGQSRKLVRPTGADTTPRAERAALRQAVVIGWWIIVFGTANARQMRHINARVSLPSAGQVLPAVDQAAYLVPCFFAAPALNKRLESKNPGTCIAGMCSVFPAASSFLSVVIFQFRTSLRLIGCPYSDARYSAESNARRLWRFSRCSSSVCRSTISAC